MGEVREEIARIIHPQAFDNQSEEHLRADARQLVVQARNHALARADAILALPSLSQGVGEEEGGSSVAGVQAVASAPTAAPRSAGWVSACCGGERCFCGRPAERKVEEALFSDDHTAWREVLGRQSRARHPLTSYVCFEHFAEIMGPAAIQWDARASSPAESRAGTLPPDAPSSSLPPPSQGSRVEDGWVLVPREPTEAMLSVVHPSWQAELAANYRAMLAALPQQHGD